MHGILLIDKAEGWTSFDCIAKLRGALRERRIGHSGTLDPLATGVLPLYIGGAARAISLLPPADKLYRASMQLGLTTDTQDITGRVTAERDYPRDPAAVWRAVEKFQGEIIQKVPIYSAVKVGGQTLYKLARRGESVETPTRKITVHSVTPVTADAGAGRYVFDVHCSSGTYVRALCHDIGQALGCGAAMAALRRLRHGDFSIERCMTVERAVALAAEGAIEGQLIPVDSLFRHLPAIELGDSDAARFFNGAVIRTKSPDGLIRAYHRGAFAGLLRAEGGVARVHKNLFEGGRP